MDYIRLDSIKKTGSRVLYEYSVSETLKQCFTDKSFYVEYPAPIEMIPKSVLAVPFVCNVLPIIWLSDSELILDSLDEDFCRCIDEIKNAYKKMYPLSKFKGKYCIKNVVRNLPPKNGKCCAMYSGGLDAFQTLISHISEEPDLITVWGADISTDNETGWRNTYVPICETAQKYKLDNYEIKSSFRTFFIDWKCEVLFGEKLNDTWWHGIQHGLGLLGLTAPIAWMNGYEKVYIASSFTVADEPITCASHPSIDNLLRFCGCKAIHDGYEFNRQEKMHNVIEFCKANGISQKLHVCWQTETGENCCSCEKCYRTIASILAENADPKLFGFDNFEAFLPGLEEIAIEGMINNPEILIKQWGYTQSAIIRNKKALKNNPHWWSISWLTEIDLHALKKQKKKENKYIKKLKKKLNRKRELFRFWHELSLKKNDVVLVGTPNYPNIGDSAIAMAELMFLEDCGIDSEHIKEISCYDYNKFKKHIEKVIHKKKIIICLIGGGNMGDQWTDEESFRQDIVSTYPDNPIIIFPQTLFFSYTPDDELEEFMSVYNRHNKLTVVAREMESYNLMTGLLKGPTVLLTPDIVLWLTAEKLRLTNAEREGVMFVFRSDSEQEMTMNDREKIMDAVREKNLSFSTTDTVLPKGEVIIKENRNAKVLEKLSEFASAKLVITDRLHGMIFSAVTGTPCIALDNNNHKVKGTYDWIENLSYIRFANTCDEATALISDLLELKDCKYDNTKFSTSYDKLKLAIQNAYKGCS